MKTKIKQNISKAIISLTIAMLLVPQLSFAQDKLKQSNHSLHPDCSHADFFFGGIKVPKHAATDQQNNTGSEELMPLLKLFEALNDEKYFEKPLGKEAKDRILKAVETPENKWVIKFVQDMESRGIGLVPALYAMKTILNPSYQGDIAAYLEKAARDMCRYSVEDNLRIYERANGVAKDRQALKENPEPKLDVEIRQQALALSRIQNAVNEETELSEEMRNLLITGIRAIICPRCEELMVWAEAVQKDIAKSREMDGIPALEDSAKESNKPITTEETKKQMPVPDAPQYDVRPGASSFIDSAKAKIKNFKLGA